MMSSNSSRSSNEDCDREAVLQLRTRSINGLHAYQKTLFRPNRFTDRFRQISNLSPFSIYRSQLINLNKEAGNPCERTAISCYSVIFSWKSMKTLRETMLLVRVEAAISRYLFICLSSTCSSINLISSSIFGYYGRIEMASLHSIISPILSACARLGFC